MDIDQNGYDTPMLDNVVHLTEQPIVPGSPMNDLLHAPVTDVSLSLLENERVDDGTPIKAENSAKLRTCYVFDTRMLEHWPIVTREDDDSPHPEQPARISQIHTLLRSNSSLERMQKIPTRFLEKLEAMLVHSEDHWDKVEAIGRELSC